MTANIQIDMMSISFESYYQINRVLS